ncbi:MAG: ergothioneine biosynthesis protein EgtB [Salinivirgaceae bacterium]|nr:MAG: ergothioneine biosynthesis protein EgtB [Salinivirgaceae bacterium]
MPLKEKYQKVRYFSVEMCNPLEIEDYIAQSAFFASPPKWNLAHTTWFFEEMILKKFFENYKEFNTQYNYLFNSYYNTLGERINREQRGSLSRPTVKEVFEYRSYVDDHMIKLMESELVSPEVLDLIVLGINHEQQHQELFFTDLKYNFSKNTLYPAYSQKALVESENEVEPGFIKIDAGLYYVGYNGNGFHFDNEKNAHKVFLESYEISKTLVTNSDFIEFINDGGYERYEFWHDDALAWKESIGLAQPLYWKKNEGKWMQYTLAGLRQVNPKDLLAHVSYYEASAFANWKGMRLPTEFEWEVAADQLHWGKRWEFTESAYLPYPGYEKAAGAVGEYNGKFMVNQKVLRGASVVTPEGHSRKTYRNFFHPNMAWQYTGIRLVKK